MGNLRPQVIAHEIELMFAIALSRMAREFRRRRGKDQPSTAGIDAGKAKHVPKKGSVGLGVACIDDGMHACNHGHLHRCDPLCALAHNGHMSDNAGAERGDGWWDAPLLCYGSPAFARPSTMR